MTDAARRLTGAAIALAAAGALMAGTGALAGPALVDLAGAVDRPGARTPLDVLLAGGSAAVLVVTAVWLVITLLATVVEALTGVGSAAVAAMTPVGVRRLVAVACGVALGGGSTLGATAATVVDGSPDRATVHAAGAGAGPARGAVLPRRVAPPLTGLPLPDRVLGRVPLRTADRAPTTYLVHPGDSLWSVAAARLPAATATEVDAAWRQIYRANRNAVGDDPDLLLPGTTLRIPPRLDEPVGDHHRKDHR